MIVKSFVVTLILSVGLISAVTGASYSNVYVERDVAPKEYYQYGTPYASIVNPQLSQVNALPPVPGYISPCAPPCVLPGQAIAPSGNVITYNAPSLPVIIAPKEDPVGYQYQYVVYDEHTGDHKAQREQSDGSVVRGEYSFLQPDGYIREVQYVADDVSGFNAVVRNFLPVTVEGKKRGENKGQKNSALHCLEVKSETLKKGSAESEQSSENQGLNSNLHETDSNHRSEELSEESKLKTKPSDTKGSHDTAHDSQQHVKNQNKSENKSGESGSSEKNQHSKFKHESEDVSLIHHKDSKKGAKTESSEESNDHSKDHTKGKHLSHSDDSEQESIEKHKSKKGPKHSESSEESTEISKSEESGKQSKESSKSKARKGHNSGEKSGHETEHGSSNDSGQGSEHESKYEPEHNSGHGSKDKSGHDSEHGSSLGSKHGSEETESHEKDKSSHQVDEHQVLVPYNDIVRCLMQALKRSQGLPAGMRQEPSALSYLVLNKPC